MYGEKIKSKRKENKLSQEELANKLGITRQAISKWETEKSTPTMTNLRELSEVFGVEMAYFIADNKEEIEEKDKKEENIKKVNKKKMVFKGIWDIFIYACLLFIGIFFFSVYYFLFIERFLGKDPSEMPYLILTIYMIIALISFPQAYKDVAEKLEGLEYNVFSKLVLPVIYMASPIIVFYYIVKKKD